MKTDMRKEERVMIPSGSMDRFLKKIAPLVNLVSFDNPCNRTLYFNTIDHVVPFETSIKGRTYDKMQATRSFQLYPDETWIFEMKEDEIVGNDRMRHKEREEKLTLKEIVKRLNGLQPIVADSYERKHFQMQSNEKFRITVDSNTKYFRIDGMEATEMGSEDFCRVEIKIPELEINSSPHIVLSMILETCNAERVISKKDAAYNLLSAWQRIKFNRPVARTDTEIEAKLLLGKDDQNVFNELLKDFRSGTFHGYETVDLPVAEGGKIHVYVNGKDYIRLSKKGTIVKAIFKEDDEIIDGVLKRREVEIPMSEVDPAAPKTLLYRKRKYFLVEKRSTGLSLCIMIDRVTKEEGVEEMFQIEVEKTALSPTKEEAMSYANCISMLVKEMIARYPLLKSTSMTKKEWLYS